MIRNEQERIRIGKRIAELRKTIEWTDSVGINRTGMTQTEMGERTGLSQAHIARIEQGKYNIQIDTLGLIAGAFGMTIDFIEK